MTRLNVTSLFSIAILAAVATLSGCSSSEPANVMENADQEAIQSYEDMVAEEEAMMSQDPGDAEYGCSS